MAVDPRALELQAQLDEQLAQVSATQERLLILAWAAAWAEVSADLRDTILDLVGKAAETTAAGGRLTRAALLRSVRLRGVLADIGDRLTALTDQAGVVITTDLTSVVTAAADAQAEIARVQLPDDDGDIPDDVLELLDPDLRPSTRSRRVLDAIVERTTGDITSRLAPVSDETAAAIRAELMRGVAVGENPRRTAARMVERTERRFNGGLARALNIARTEVLDAHRAAAAAEQAAEADVLAGWVWLCHLDARTCVSCLVRHGQLHPLDEDGPHDHPQGRCARMPKTKTWRELGIDLDEPEDTVPDAREWFDALTPAEQKRILGPTRYALLVAGEISWEDLSSRRENAGWRPSYQVTSVKALRARTVAAAS